MLVEEVMTSNVEKIDCNKTVLDTCKHFSKSKVGSLVVMDKNITVGIITERDIIEKSVLLDRDPKKTKIIDIMSPNLKTVHALAPLEKAVKIMKENNIKKLPVILNNEIVGIITETDLSRTVEAFTETIEDLEKFYSKSRNDLERMMDEWEDILVNLKSFKKYTDEKEMESLL